MQKKLFFLLSFFLFAFLVSAADNDTIRVLTIGNSFSEDAVENYLYDIGKADGVVLIIGNMYIGGCSLETHWNNADQDRSSYSYRKINAKGVKTTTENTKLSTAIPDEPWDYIGFQQVSQNSGMYSTYFPYLASLLNYAKGLATNPDVEYVLHMTWAYAQNSDHSGFNNYNKNQLQMYNAIVDAATRAAEEVDINIVVPAGTAIQNARTSYLGDTFCRDGYHLNLGIGRYTAACTWYEKLTGRSVVGNTYVSGSLRPNQIEIAQKAAHLAVETPNSVTVMDDEYPLPDPNTYMLKSSINIDFGSGTTQSPFPWNNMTSWGAGNSLLGLSNTDGDITPISIEITKAFGGINSDGPKNNLVTDEWTIIKSAVEDSFWGNAGAIFANVVTGDCGFRVSGLNKEQEYNFRFIASRTASDNREAFFKIEGADGESAPVYINTSSNTKVVSFDNIKPKADGTVNITMGAGPNNNQNNKFFYLNALQIDPVKKVPQIDPNTYLLASPINIDFGEIGMTSPFPWNNLTSYGEGSSILNLFDMNEEVTPISVKITKAFGGPNSAGLDNDLQTNAWNILKDAAKDSFWGNAGTIFANVITGNCGLQLYDLNPNQEYTLRFFSSRAASDNREVFFTVSGQTEKTLHINSSSNEELLTFEKVKPKADGTIDITLGAGPNNDQVNKFFYLNALQIAPAQIGMDLPLLAGNEKNIILYPNPVVDVIYLKGLEEAAYEYTITGMDGKLITKGLLGKGENEINVSYLTSNHYILTLCNSISRETSSQRLVVMPVK